MSERKTVYGIILALLSTVAIPLSMVVPVEASSTAIEVINASVGSGNFKFYTNTTRAGFRFNATIWIRDAVNLSAFEIYLTVNDTVLNTARAWLPSLDSRYVFFGLPRIHGPLPIPHDIDGDGSNEAVMIGDALLASGITFTGRKLAAIVEFQILYEPTVQQTRVQDYLNINNVETYLLDDSYSQIPAIVVSGYCEYNYVVPVHDVAVTGVKSNKTVVGQGHIAPIMVAVENQGNYMYCTETFNVTVYANTTAVGTQTVTNSPLEAKQTLTFSWNTSDFTVGNYTIWAYAEPLADEVDTTDNTMTSPTTVKVFLGDVSNDNKVDIRDIAQVALSFGTYLGHAEWDPVADLNKDEKVDIRDLVIVAKNFGQLES